MDSLEKPHISNDLFVWSEEDPDLELVEPKILVSINGNYLKFGRKIGRPALSHCIRIVNHGEHPVAFKVQTTDNYAYFVNKVGSEKVLRLLTFAPFPVYGVISGRRLHCLPHVRMPNSEELVVSRRPYDTFSEEQQRNYFNTPKKNTLFILLAPVFSFTSPPAAAFHNGAAYEKLRVCLDYTGAPSSPEDKNSLVNRKAKGWCTWEISKEEMAKHVEMHPPKMIYPSTESRMQPSRDQLQITQESDASQKSRRRQEHPEAEGNMSQKNRTLHKLLQMRTGAEKGALPKAKEDSGERKSRKSDRTQSVENSMKKREGNSRSESKSKKPQSKSAPRKDKQSASKRDVGLNKTDRTMVDTMKLKKTNKE